MSSGKKGQPPKKMWYGTAIHVFRTGFRKEHEKWPKNTFWKIKIGQKIAKMGKFGCFQHVLCHNSAIFQPSPVQGGGWCNPPWGFSRIAKKRWRVAPPGLGLPDGANLAQFLAKKNWPGQVRSRSYDVIRGTTSGNFSNKVVFSRNLTWRHWCKW